MNVDAQFLQEVEAIARRAGHAIMRVYAREFSVQEKADRSPLTEADSVAHSVIAMALGILTPSVPILSEEAVEAFPRSFSGERYWLVDPLDGTKEFIKRNGEFTVNIALIERGRVVLGVVLGIGGVAGHSHKYSPRGAEGYFSRLRIVHNVSAVTGAALLIRKEVFDAVGGLDEQGLTVAFNDVDLCLKVMKAGYRNLWTPFAELYHHESKTRGTDLTPERQSRFQGECELMRRRWGDLISRDPYYSPHLTMQHENYSLAMQREQNQVMH